ncbi:non-ribosomal peptide synthetase [Streptomyces sp. NPDC001348]
MNGVSPGTSEPGPLSHEQESLWYREWFADQQGLTNVPAALRVRGPLQVAALRQACAELVRRHPALRTVFGSADGVPWQRENEDAEPDFARSAASGEQEVRRLARTELLRPFDLAQGRPVRFRLYRITDDHHVLVLIAHHLVIDAASVGICLTELAEFYRAAVTGGPARLRRLTARYADAVAMQRADVDEERLAELTEYWTSRLHGAPHHSGLVTDRPRPRRRRALGGVVKDRIPVGTAQALGRFAEQARATEFIVALAAFRALLWRSCGQPDLLIGAPVSGREHPGTETMVGFFINMLVMRSVLSDTMTFREAVHAEREAVLGAFDHRDMPYPRLVSAVRPDRDPASSPLVQVTFSYRPDDAAPPALPGLSVTGFDLDGTSLQFDLVLELLGDADGIEVLCGYDEDLFDRSTITGLTARLVRFLAAAVAEPDRPLAGLPWLTPADLETVHRAAVTASDGEAPDIVQSVHRWALQRPQATAVRHADRVVTYAGLEADGDAVAARLLRAGGGCETVVGVLLDDRAELPAVMLGVAKAGCALLPLDPAHPPERHAYVLRDARAGVLITDRDGAAAAAPGLAVLAPRAAAGSPPGPLPAPDPDRLAYVIYTSGSTGRPKGVGITHHSLANCLRDARDRFGIGPGTRVASASHVAFDIGVLEVFMPLAAGAELVLSEAHRRGNGAEIAAFLGRQAPDVFFATPALWEMLLLTGWPGDPSMTALTGGDVLAPALADRLRAAVRRVGHLYGPTETTVYSTAEDVPARGALPEILPVGRPVRGTTACVLDASLRPVPPGVIGELCIGGAGVARGYPGRPALTAEKFVPSPLGPAGARLYRTGDLARLLPDGRLELRGRDDDQIKINGHRIELREIESVLGGCVGVDAVSAVVAGPRDGTGPVRGVVACVRPAPGQDPAALEAAMREHAERRLPPVMLPSAYVLCDTFPVTANGKLDRSALTELAARQVAADAGGRGAPPATRHEKAVAGLWARTLGLPAVAADGDFFRLGGNSLLAAQMTSRLESELGVRLPMSALLEAPTVAGFAERLRRAQDGAAALPAAGSSPGEGASMTWLRRGRRTPVLALAHPAGGSALCYRELVAALDGDWQVCAFETEDADERGVEQTAAAYLRELRAEVDGPVVYAGWSLGGLLAYEMAVQEQLDRGGLPVVVAVDTAVPSAFDWEAELEHRSVLRTFVRDVARLSRTRISPPETLWSAPAPEVFSWLADAVGFADVRELERRCAITSANLRSVRDYRPRPAEVELHFVEAAEERPQSQAWLELADTVTVTVVPGDHYNAISGANAVRLARLLSTLG